MSMRDAATLARTLSTDVSEVRMNPVSYNPDGSWQGLPADVAARKEQRVSVWMESLDDSHSRMADVLDTQADADARWDAAPSEADVNRARADWVRAVLGDDDAEAARLKAVYESLDAERKAEKARWEKACEETSAALKKLAGECAVPEDTRTTPGDETTDPADDPDAEDEDEKEMDGDDEDEEEKELDGDDKFPETSPTDPTTSPTPSPSKTPQPESVTSPTTQQPSSGYQEQPHIVMDTPRTELSSDSSSPAAQSTPKVYPSSTQQPATFTAAPNQPSVTMPTNITPAAQTPAQQTAQQSQQAYRPAPSPSTHPQRESKVDGSDPIGVVPGGVPVATPVHSPMPSGGSTVSAPSPSTSLSSSGSAPNAPAAAHPNAAPAAAAPVGTPPPSVGAGNKTTTVNNTKVITAADQPDSAKSSQESPLIDHLASLTPDQRARIAAILQEPEPPAAPAPDKERGAA